MRTSLYFAAGLALKRGPPPTIFGQHTWLRKQMSGGCVLSV
jgi:hypothetical protein